MQPWIALFTAPFAAAVSEQPPVAAWTVWTAIRPIFQAKPMRGEFDFEDYSQRRASCCTLNGRHVWEHLHTWEQLLNNEAHQVKRQKRGDRWSSVPAHADWMHQIWHSQCCTPAGETSSISLRQNVILIHLWVRYTEKSADLFDKVGVELHYKNTH